MSDTPITDKKAIDITGGLYGVTHLRRNPKGNFVRVNFARQLERENAALRKLINEPYQFFRFGHKALFPWGKFLDRWCKRAEKLGFKKEAKP